MSADHSLLSFLSAPVLVGDPDGCAAYVNPAFEARFRVTGADVLGLPLAELFEGGAREGVLRAVASVCDQNESVHFRIRDAEVAYSVVASPITAEDTNVGVILLMKEEVEGLERLLSLHREIREPLEELDDAMQTLMEQTGGRRAERYRSTVEDGLRALQHIHKFSDEIAALLSGGHARESGAAFDPAPLVRQVADRAARVGGERGIDVELIVPASLPALRGDETRFQTVLQRLVQARIDAKPMPKRITLAARALGAEAGGSVLVSVSEELEDGQYEESFSDDAVMKESIADLGGILHAMLEPVLGRTTLACFPTVPK